LSRTERRLIREGILEVKVALEMALTNTFPDWSANEREEDLERLKERLERQKERREELEEREGVERKMV
jgi:hypothetical protein